jgi:hypothetical protein
MLFNVNAEIRIKFVNVQGGSGAGDQGKKYTISKKSVTKQRTELGIGNSKKSLLRNIYSMSKKENDGDE